MTATYEPQPPDSSRLLFTTGYIDVYSADGLVVMVDVRRGVRTVTTMEPNDARFLARALLGSADDA